MAEDSASASRRSSARSRKAVARFDPISKARYELMKKHEEEAAADPTPGPGDTPFGDIDFVVAGIGKHGSNDEVLILLHRALYGRDGKNTTRKAGLRKWFGTKDDGEVQRLTRSMNSTKWTTHLLGELCVILGLDKSGNKSEVVDRVISMLLAPTAEHPDKKLLVAKPKRKNVAAKRKAKGGKKKKKKASSGAKRTQSSYMLWMNAEGRAAAKAANPDAKMTEIASIAGAAWRELSDEAKQPYIEQAAELKEAAGAEAAKVPKSRARASPAKPRKRKAAAAGADAPPAKQSKNGWAMDTLKTAKEMLDNGLIEEAEYNKTKAEVLSAMKSR